MSVPIGGKIRLGVVGLGPTWRERYRPALAASADRFRVAALFDQVPRRAEIEALAVRARGMASLAGLVARPDVDAVALLDPQWFGLHALALAARAGKPALVAVPLPADPAELDRLDAAIRAGGAAGSGPILVAGTMPARAALLAFERLIRGESPDPAARTWAVALADARAATPEPAGTARP